MKPGALKEVAGQAGSAAGQSARLIEVRSMARSGLGFAHVELRALAGALRQVIAL